MKTLNLTDNDKSDIKYQISKFPDGQQQVTIIQGVTSINPISKGHPNLIDSYSWQIKSRLNNFKDLELIICATQSLRNLGVKEIHLYVPYFLGLRSDRQFEEGSNNYLKQVICPIINSMNFESVVVLDPHSHILEACLNNFRKEDNTKLVRWFINQLIPTGGDIGNTILVSPDAGASHKIYKLAEQIDYKGDIITCSKKRDKDGKLTKCVVPMFVEPAIKDIIIIDDICDGGATFINIAKEIKQVHNNKIYLIVTHGIFSKGFDELSKYFDGVYCTNSYKDIEDYDIEFGDSSSIRQNNFIKNNIKQLNIF